MNLDSALNLQQNMVGQSVESVVIFFFNYSRFNMSFMIGFSINAIEGVVATKGSFNSKKFRKFIIDLFKEKSVETVFLWIMQRFTRQNY